MHAIYDAVTGATSLITSSISWVDIVSTLVLPLILPTLVGLATNSKWPTLAKRLSLGGLTLIATVLQNLVEAAVSNTPYDIGMGLVQFLATWGLAELAYYGLLKAPITVSEPQLIEATPVPDDLDSLTKAQLVNFIQNVPVATVSVADPPKSIASVIAVVGNK
jgi:hypothetical protein